MKRLLSYLFPIRIKNYYSSINGRLEININNGTKMLDSDVSNYSYGSLQKILHKGLIEISIHKQIINILLLGLGGGSVIQTLREEFKCNAAITTVEIDAEIIKIALDDFNLGRFDNISIIQADAKEYIANAREVFDLIIVDIFIGNSVPETFTKSEFLNDLFQRLSLNGSIIYNIMRDTMPYSSFTNLKASFVKNGLKMKIIENVEGTNNLIIAENQSLTSI